MRRRTRLIIGGAVVICAVALLALPVRSAIIASVSCGQVTGLNAARQDSEPVSEGEPTAVILGDSYAQGQYLDHPREQAWSTRAGELLGTRTYVNAIGGTGITNAGRCGDGLFADRIPAVLDDDPALVIIQTGLNESPGHLSDSAADVLSALADIPEVVIVGPVLAPNRDADTLRAIDEALRVAAESAGHTYISMLELNPEYIDGLHMTAAGHEAFAQMVVDRLDASRDGGSD